MHWIEQCFHTEDIIGDFRDITNLETLLK